MKKLIALAATAACGAALAVESANIVGYSENQTSGKYNAAGFCFTGVSSDGTVTLGDISASGWNYENDFLQVLNPGTCANDKELVWLTKEEAEGGEVGDKAGWYDASEFTYEGATVFDLGAGFLTSLGSSNVKLTSAGAVYDQAFTLECPGKYVIIPNALPRKIKLSELTADGWNYENDFLQLLNSATCANDKELVWLTKEEAEGGEVGDKAGWYDASEFTYEGDNIELEPGQGLLTSLGSTGVRIHYPKAIPDQQ